MIRLFCLAFAVLLFSSCSQQNIRFVKAGEHTNKEYRTVEVNNAEERSNSRHILNTQSVESGEIEITEPTEFVTDEVQKIESDKIDNPKASSSSPAQENKASTSPKEISDETTEQAYRAESNARTAKVIFITSSILTVLTGFLGILLMGFGIHFYVKSSRARYITAEGDRQLGFARIGLIVNLVLVTLYVLLIFLILFILL
ncbi:MAG: hypothetical protein ACI837_000308 [Crocinitomicaceae bacterium]|jgi:hypothetical protein